MDIIIDDLQGKPIMDLLQEHLTAMAMHSPEESVHALDIENLRKPNITVWSAMIGEKLIGCGALKELDSTHAEIKSMRTASSHLRKGVASNLLKHIIQQSKLRGYQRLSLETGSMLAFAPARRLYSQFGFEVCSPFAGYTEDPFSVFMSKDIN